MPDVILGATTKLEGKFHPAKRHGNPTALLLHPHPVFGGSMNNALIYQCYYALVNRGFSVLRFNFRGVGKSQGTFDHGVGELEDANSGMDLLNAMNPLSFNHLLIGFSFGAWIGSQMMIRRPEVTNFVAINPPSNLYDFSEMTGFCPASALIISAELDAVVPKESTEDLVFALTQKKRMWTGGEVEHVEIPGANHFFDGKLPEVVSTLSEYVERKFAYARS